MDEAAAQHGPGDRAREPGRELSREPGHGAGHPTGRGRLVGWRGTSPAEYRWPSAAAVVVAVVVQVLLPDGVVLHPRWLLPGTELVLVGVLTAVNPVRLVREHPLLRLVSLALVVAVTLATVASAVLLLSQVLSGRASGNARALLGSGAAVYSTAVIAFALWYWEFDRGGPYARAHGREPRPDFLFAQMTAPEVAGPDWESTFVDYLYLSFTNATAFSPTDTLPLAHWAKMVMLVQSSIALSTVALVIARAVNVLS